MKEIIIIAIGILAGAGIMKLFSPKRNTATSPNTISYEEKNSLIIKELCRYFDLNPSEYNSWSDTVNKLILSEGEKPLINFKEGNKNFYSKIIADIKLKIETGENKTAISLLMTFIDRLKRDGLID